MLTIPFFSAGVVAREVPITAHGAVADDEKPDTVAIQNAIRDCHDAGGGRVIVPAGKFRIETIRLASKVELHLEEGAVLLGSTDEATYGGIVLDAGNRKRQARWNRGLIIGESLREISITGKGIIDGNNVRDAKGEEGMRGPHTVLLQNCEEVKIDGIGIRDSGNYALLFYSCRNLTVENAAFTGGWDGVHFRGSPQAWNHNTNIRNCRFETGDDSIAGHYIEDSAVENCTINSSCNGIRLIGPARRWTIRDCTFDGPGKHPHITQSRHNMLAGILLQPGAWGRSPGPVEDIAITGIEMKNVACAFQIVAGAAENPMARIKVSELNATGIYQAASSVEAWNGASVDDIQLKSIELSYTDAAIGNVSTEIQQPVHVARPVPAWGIYLRSLKNVRFDESVLEKGVHCDAPAILADKVHPLSLEKTRYPGWKASGSEAFRKIE